MDRDKRRATYKRNVVGRYKRLKGCLDCGYNENSLALEFHHIGGNKHQTVASLMYRSWKIIKAEIAKCDVICANCHAIRTLNK